MKHKKLFCSPAKRIFQPFDPTLTAYDPQQREVKILNVPCKITTRSAKFLKENRVITTFRGFHVDGLPRPNLGTLGEVKIPQLHCEVV